MTSGGHVRRLKPKARMDAYEEVFTALAHPTRRLILLTLNFEGGSMMAGEIANVFEHSWPTTTRHIRVLESAGLLYHDRHGRTRVYHIDRRRLSLVRDWLAWFLKDPHSKRQQRKRWQQGKRQTKQRQRRGQLK